MPPNKSEIKILVIDDSPMILEVVKGMLLSHGFGVVDSIDNYSHALARVRSAQLNSYHLLILDKYLGDESGLEVLREVRKTNEKIPVIMLTQEDSGPKVLEAIASGATDYIIKPFSQDILISKVEKLVLK